ncbi:binding-protein-dependent transport systems inner membrane component [Haladaptatus paucihalophilus DX253]|uniref:Binding-protein-dependent transport systems inner membrane component n=1 Tax=Haladaptatus paucihalophilus DX253 TaxID=797209 RepID=E7QZC3_HALPU|nr:ABC transporter permease [Haladaptatus paucihalophilus]EFW90044.1 binding-protein-dependent transport systems inner membrane component [Haladaptatus paucihalophilus DX253]SHL03599.1 peptide/nickel transport system permease protein [Haladaptatus paucihalophilus DX253]
MANYYVKRTARALLTLWLVVTLTFGMIRLLPGGPLTQLRGKLIRQGYPPQQINSIIETYQNLQPDAPLYAQYFDYITALLHGDMGKSFTYPRTVASIIGEALPWTIFVMVTATIIIFAIAIVWGALMAYKEGTRFDMVSSSLSILLSSIPFYVLAIGLVVLLGYKFQVLPVRYRLSPGVEPGFTLQFVTDALYHAFLPIVSLVISGAGLQALAMRGNSIQVLGEDYVRVARLRGLSDRRISVWYVGRNAVLPMYTGFLTLIGFNLGGSVILEQIFTYPGVGYYLFQGLQNRDYPLMMGIFLVITTALVLSVYIADLSYGRIDPRVQSGDSSEAY